MPSANVSEPSNGALTTNGNGKAHVRPTANSDMSTYRRLVPLVHEGTVTYLNASFAPPSNMIVHEAITKYASEALYNPLPKPTWQATMQDARRLLARYINTDSSNIAFTRDTTEALGSIIHGLHFKPGDNVVLLDTEHPNHAYQWMSLRPLGLQVRQVPTIEADKKSGKLRAANAETFAPYVDDRTIAIGLSSVMFHSGQWNDVAHVCSIFRPRGIHVIADITQQVGFATVDVQALDVSAAAFSLHKGLHCPTGLAALYVGPDFIKTVDPTPPIVGYGAVSNARADLLVPDDPIVYHQSAQRYNHLNLSLVSAAVAKAYLSFYLDVLGPKKVESHLYSLGDLLRKECRSLAVNIVGSGSRQEHAPHLYVLDLHDERWMPHLRGNGIIVTPYRLGIRVSLGFYNNTEDIKNLVSVLRSGIEMGISVP